VVPVASSKHTRKDFQVISWIGSQRFYYITCALSSCERGAEKYVTFFFLMCNVSNYQETSAVQQGELGLSIRTYTYKFMLTITCTIASLERYLSRLRLLKKTCNIIAEMMLEYNCSGVFASWCESELRERSVRLLAEQTTWQTVQTNRVVFVIQCLAGIWFI